MNRLSLILTLVAAALAAGAGDAFAENAPAVEESTVPVRRTIDDLYQGSKFRDPFSVLDVGGGGAVTRKEKEFILEEFSIHALHLKGIMKERDGVYALLTDPESGMGFLLKGGKLLTNKKERVPGVTGRIDHAQKTVVLMTPDKDVQILRLGEKDDENDKDAEKSAGQERSR